MSPSSTFRGIENQNFFIREEINAFLIYHPITGKHSGNVKLLPLKLHGDLHQPLVGVVGTVGHILLEDQVVPWYAYSVAEDRESGVSQYQVPSSLRPRHVHHYTVVIPLRPRQVYIQITAWKCRHSPPVNSISQQRCLKHHNLPQQRCSPLGVPIPTTTHLLKNCCSIK